jgi:hypothetical protein
MKQLKEKLHKEHGQRWIGNPDYSCLTCSHSMSTEENQLICVVDAENHQPVSDDYLCKKWI